MTVSYGQYRAILATRREQSDRATAFLALHDVYQASLNTYASLYNGVCQRDWFQARARGYGSTLEAALHGDNIPTSVVENLIETTRAGVEPLRRYHRLRRRILNVPSYHVYDFSIPIVTYDRKYTYDEVLDWVVEAVAPLGPEYQARMREGFSGGWIDVYENEGKRSGAYSAPVYGTHPYMLLNYTDTLDDMFTLTHEMGHSMHTILSHETQPFVYSSYTIFVAEVPSTLNEALLLEYLLARTSDPIERIFLLQHAIDNITGTFYTQVLFADYELRAHRLAEQDQPITAEILTETYTTAPEGLLRRRRRPHAADRDHLGAHPALLQLALLRVSIRHVLRLGGAHRPVDHARQPGGAGRRARALPDAPPRRRQRSSDGLVEEGGDRSEPAGHGAGNRAPARRSGQPPRAGGRQPAVSRVGRVRERGSGIRDPALGVGAPGRSRGTLLLSPRDVSSALCH